MSRQKRDENKNKNRHDYMAAKQQQCSAIQCWIGVELDRTDDDQSIIYISAKTYLFFSSRGAALRRAWRAARTLPHPARTSMS